MKLLNTIKKHSLKLSAIGACALPATFAAATETSVTDLTTFHKNVAGAFGSGANILYIIAAIIGIVFVIAGLFKAKAHSMDMQGTQGGSKQSVVLIIIGACLIAIPVIMMASSTSLFGGTSANHFQLPQESGALNTGK